MDGSSQSSHMLASNQLRSSPKCEVKQVTVSLFLCLYFAIGAIYSKRKVLGFYCCDKIPWPQRSWVVVFFILKLAGHHPEKSGKEFKARTWSQELKQRPWRDAACWLVPRNFFTASGTTCSAGPTTSITNQENTLQAYPQANLVGLFFHLRFPFPQRL